VTQLRHWATVFTRNVRAGKGDTDGVVMLPAVLRDDLMAQLEQVTERWRADVPRGCA
jgi:hypothetical protein